jgi:hypothetical protein
MEIKRFATMPLNVSAVRVIEENLEEVASWCKGQAMGIKLPRNERVIEYVRDGKEYYAEVGDWIVRYNADGFYTYNDRLFQQRFISY